MIPRSLLVVAVLLGIRLLCGFEIAVLSCLAVILVLAASGRES